MLNILSKLRGFFISRTMVGVDKAGNSYFTRKEEIDGAMKEKRWVVFKGEEDPSSIPVEWICWLNGQRKKAPTPEEMIELEARRECVRRNVALLKKKEEERKSLGGGIRQSKTITYYLNPRFQYTVPGIDMDDELLAALRNVIYKIVPDPEIASLCIQETKPFREGTDSFGVSTAVVSKKKMNPGTSGSLDLKIFIQQFPGASFDRKRGFEEISDEIDGTKNKDGSSEPNGSGESFKPGTWQPPT